MGKGKAGKAVKTWEVRGLHQHCCLLHMAGSWIPPDIGWVIAFSFQDSSKCSAHELQSLLECGLLLEQVNSLSLRCFGSPCFC